MSVAYDPAHNIPPRAEAAPAAMESSAAATAEQPLWDPAIQAILDEARARRRRDADARRLHQQAEARFQRAYRAWRRVAAFQGDAIPVELTAAERRHIYAELIVALGRVLKEDGWQARLDALTAGTGDKTYAVAMLRKAMDGDRAAVEAMVHEAIASLWMSGVEADDWLREGLMYEVLDIRRPPEPPRGWEGSYREPVETVADLLRWIDRESLIPELVGQVEGDRPSDGRLVRNAFRLVSELGLDGLPAEPVGPWTSQDELAVLRNLRRLCQPSARPADAGSPAALPCPAEGRSKSADRESGPADPAEETSAEASVRCYLAGNPAASLRDVTAATALSAWTVLRMQEWKDHQERVLDAYLRGHPEAKTRDVRAAFGWSRPKVVGMWAWQEHQARKEATRARRRMRDKERPLTGTMLSCRVDEAAADPAAQISRRDQLFRAVLEHADPDTRAGLHGLKSADREALLDRLLTSVDGDEAQERVPEETLALLVEVARSLLDEREQETRHERRGRRREAI